MKLNILLLLVLVLFAGCSSPDSWTHIFAGEGDSWRAIMEIGPKGKSNSSDVVYTFKLTKKIENEVSKVNYEAHIVHSKNGGNLDELDIKKVNQKEVLTLFSEFPNFSTPGLIGKDTSKEELETYFSDLRIDIIWEDDNGEHVEEIFLKLD
jgi:hypothetical protein